jgi:hypothetical protein
MCTPYDYEVVIPSGRNAICLIGIDPPIMTDPAQGPPGIHLADQEVCPVRRAAGFVGMCEGIAHPGKYNPPVRCGGESPQLIAASDCQLPLPDELAQGISLDQPDIAAGFVPVLKPAVAAEQ